MTEAELKAIVQAAGGGCWALDNAGALLEKITRVKSHHCVSDAGGTHPRDSIHGVVFLFRKPTELAALSYELSSVVVWNPALIDETRAKPVFEAFHQIFPPAKSC